MACAAAPQGDDVESSGKDATESEGDEPADAAEICARLEAWSEECGYGDDYCTEYQLALFEDPVCGPHELDFFGCLGELPCSPLPQEVTECADEYETGYEACPDRYPLCLAEETTFDNGCTFAGAACLDGNEYGLRCVEGNATFTCTCERNGEEVGSFMFEDPFDCTGTELDMAAGDACGFPPKTIPHL